MKKRIVLFTAVIGVVYLSVSSYSAGPAININHYDCTGNGINSNVLSSCGGSGCHGTGTGPVVQIELDSNGGPVTHYIAGGSYSIRITGTGTTNNYFGFQMCVLHGTGSSQTTCGVLTAPITGHTAPAVTPYVPVPIVEHSSPIHASSAGNYVIVTNWTAPTTAGAGTMHIYAAINAVNGDGIANPADLSGHAVATITESVASSSVASVLDNASIKAYPVPFSNQFHLQLNNADAGIYTLKAYDISGKRVLNQNVEVNSSNYETAINTTNWAPGFYGVQIVKDGAQRIIPVIKQ